ncbi:MAG: hypothetical protein LQ342_006776 [Letrouitia transgressa]|nr:MAG: hypothetical protein LQ342_006776 [Letrouitia transgressa]
MHWYPQWLEEQLKTLPSSTISAVAGHDPNDEACWSPGLTKVFSEVARHAKSDGCQSIDDIADCLIKGGVVEAPASKEGAFEVRNFVFAVVGWQTMLYKPALGICPPQQLAVTDEQDGYRGQAFMALKQNHVCTNRPFHEFLMGFGILLPPSNFCTCTDAEDKKAFEDLKYVGPEVFNAFLLDSIGHFRIRWVDVVSCHLELDERNNVVFLFRFPSFCACCDTAETEKEEACVIHKVASPASSGRQWACKEDISRMLKETMLSYRLLFGQNKKARRFFKTLDPFPGTAKDGQDHLLRLLCGKKSFRFASGSLDKESYDLQQDFPIMRSRISRLHKILSARKPKSWREIWHDRRDSAGWYTFWTVLIFGAVSIFLSFSQVVLQIVEVSRS